MSQPAIPVLLSINEKGGVGKSSLVKMMGEYESFIQGKRVALTDLDGQENTTKAYVDMEIDEHDETKMVLPVNPHYKDGDNCEPRSSIIDCYFGNEFHPYSSWVTPALTKNNGKIDIFAAVSERIEAFNTLYAEKVEIEAKEAEVQSEETSKGKQADAARRLSLEQAYNGLQEILSDEMIADQYDLVIIDTGPSKSIMFRAALRAATHIVVPFVPEHKCIQGINKILQAIIQEEYARPNDLPPPKLIGLMPNMVKTRTNEHRKNLEQLYHEAGDKMFPDQYYISDRIIFPELDAARTQSIFQLSDKHPAKMQVLEVCQYIHQEIFNGETS